MRHGPIIAIAALLASAGMAEARSDPYVLQPDLSEVEFQADLAGQPLHGTIPILGADIRLDLADLTECSVTVTLLAAGATTGLPFASDALLGEGVLDAARHPQARFVSTRISGTLLSGAVVKGNLTLRGVTHPVTLEADILRQRGTDPNDLSRLTVHLRGTLNRSDFGATGMANLVGDRVGLDITVRIRRAD